MPLTKTATTERLEKIKSFAENEIDFYVDRELEMVSFDEVGYNPVPLEHIRMKRKEFSKLFPHLCPESIGAYFKLSMAHKKVSFHRNFLKYCGEMYNPEMPLFESINECVTASYEEKIVLIEQIKKFFLCICGKVFAPRSQNYLAFVGKNNLSEWLCQFPFGIKFSTNRVTKSHWKLLEKNLIVKIHTRVGLKQAPIYIGQKRTKVNYLTKKGIIRAGIILEIPKSNLPHISKYLKGLKFFEIECSDKIFDVSIINLFGWAYHELFKTTII
jgi:hypothetical protein